MVRSYKYRLTPTRAQEQKLLAWLDLTRELYNAALQERRDGWQKQRARVTCFDQERALPSIREVRHEFINVPIVILRGVLRRLDRSFVAFFCRCKRGENPGYPRFKGRNRFCSLLIDDITNINKGHPIIAGGKRIAVPLLGKVKFNQHRPLKGTPKAMRIRRDGDGKWYVVLTCIDVPAEPLVATGTTVGIDLGLTTFAATSDGELISNPRPLHHARLVLERAQRRVCRRVRNSKRRHKAVVLLRHAHFRVVQMRRQHAINSANRLVRHYDTICIEKLNIRGLASGMLAKSVNDAAWGDFLHWLRCKAENAGRDVVEVDARGTSQVCSGCGCEVRKNLSVRTHDCPQCGLRLDRDVNAARNILALGLSVRRDATLTKVRQ